MRPGRAGAARQLARCARAGPALALALALAAGCERAPGGREPAEPAGAAPPAAAAVRLNWIGHWLGEDRREQLVREVQRRYEFLHPDVKINLVFNKELRGPDVDHKKNAAAAIVDMIRTGRTDWDVVFLDVATYEFVSETLRDPGWTRKHLVDFSTVPGFLESHEDFIAADPRYREKMGGIFTGPFIENYLLNLWFNTQVAQRAGIAVRERGMSFDDFVACAQRLHRYNREQGTAIPFIKLSSWNRIDALFEHLFKSQFDDFASAVARTDTPEKRRAFLGTLQAFERLARFQPAVNEGWERLSSNDFTAQYLFDDDALFIVGGTFMYSQFRGLDPVRAEKLRPVENPYLRRANGLVGDYTPVFAVMKNSPNRDVAVDFLMSWATPSNAEKWVRYTKNLTGIKGYFSDTTARDVGAFGDVYERYLVDMTAKYRGVPVVHLRTPTYLFGEGTPVSVVELRSKLAAILAGRLTARGYYEDVVRRLRGPRG